jgi:hypothetical protein
VNELATDAIVRFDLGQTAVPEADVDADADADVDAGEPEEADTEE